MKIFIIIIIIIIIIINFFKIKPHMCGGRAPWLLGQGQQLPWLLWAVH
jgi:hypothetical protein